MENFNDNHLQLLLVCNAGSFPYKQEFYKLKHAILEKHATPDGYDLQIIHKKCNRCKDGIFTHWTTGEKSDCWHCDGTSVYSVSRWTLKRYKINDVILHIPEKETLPVPEYKNIIKGHVLHVPAKGHALLCYIVLLTYYQPLQLISITNDYGKNLNTRAKHKWTIAFTKTSTILKGWMEYLGIKEQTNCLPF